MSKNIDFLKMSHWSFRYIAYIALGLLLIFTLMTAAKIAHHKSLQRRFQRQNIEAQEQFKLILKKHSKSKEPGS